MNILVTNDDGYNARGLLILKLALCRLKANRSQCMGRAFDAFTVFSRSAGTTQPVRPWHDGNADHDVISAKRPACWSEPLCYPAYFRGIGAFSPPKRSPFFAEWDVPMTV